MWRILKTDEYERRYKRYDKKKKGQLNAVLNNLDRFTKLLHLGRKPKPLVYGFLRDEGLDILRISESGAESNVAATRLYVYPETEILYLLTIGDKSTQHDDIQLCKRFVKQIRADRNLGDAGDDGHDDEEDTDEEDQGDEDS